jgi:hypothetical protein
MRLLFVYLLVVISTIYKAYALVGDTKNIITPMDLALFCSLTLLVPIIGFTKIYYKKTLKHTLTVSAGIFLCLFFVSFSVLKITDYLVSKKSTSSSRYSYVSGISGYNNGVIIDRAINNINTSYGGYVSSTPYPATLKISQMLRIYSFTLQTTGVLTLAFLFPVAGFILMLNSSKKIWSASEVLMLSLLISFVIGFILSFTMMCYTNFVLTGPIEF